MKSRVLLPALLAVAAAAAFHSAALRTAPAPSADEILARMTLEDKIGQLFMVGVRGPRAAGEMKSLIRDNRLGGVILFGGRNVTGRAQCARLTSDLQAAAIGAGAGIPLLISIDQEGGVGSHVNVLTGGVDTPGNLALGASADPHDTYLSYKIMADDLNAYGINMALAPVLDLLLNKANPMNHIRSFGSDPAAAGERGALAVRGFQENGIIATVKHFPGKGESDVDSHVHAPVSKWDRAALDRTILAPFRAAITAGADAVMIGHEIYIGLDPENVATVSEKIITGLLKTEMGFRGIVITDSITMGGMRETTGPDAASMLSIKAGADMVLFAGDSPEEYTAAMARVREAVADGTLTMQRVDDAVRRILEVKIRYGLFDNPQPTPAAEYAKRKKDNWKISRRIARRTIAIIKNDGGLIPLDPSRAEKYLVVTPKTFFSVPMMDSLFPVGTTLGIKAARAAPGVRIAEYDTATLEADSIRALELAGEAEVIIIGVVLAYFSDDVTAFVKKLKATGKPVVVVGLSVPYDLERFPEVDAFMAAFSPRSVSLEAAADALFGRFTPVGRLPVDVNYRP